MNLTELGIGNSAPLYRFFIPIRAKATPFLNEKKDNGKKPETNLTKKILQSNQEGFGESSKLSEENKNILTKLNKDKKKVNSDILRAMMNPSAVNIKESEFKPKNNTQTGKGINNTKTGKGKNKSKNLNKPHKFALI